MPPQSSMRPLPPAMFDFDVSVAEERNARWRRTMEDAHISLRDFGGVEGDGLFAVFDGHAGRHAALWCSQHFPNILKERLNVIEKNEAGPLAVTDPQRALHEAFLACDKSFAEQRVNSGCTAVACFLKRTSDGKSATLSTANVGDARAVISRDRKATRLTYDHKGSDPSEAARIVSKGGIILNERVNGCLAVTRSLGDIVLKKLVVGDAFTTKVHLTTSDEFLIIACDGIWDVMSDQEAVDFVATRLDNPETAASQLISKALENGSSDNLSAIVIFFKHPIGEIVRVREPTAITQSACSVDEEAASKTTSDAGLQASDTDSTGSSTPTLMFKLDL